MLTSEELTTCIESRRVPLTRMATSILGSPSEAEDLVQEAALSALSGLPRFRSEADICTWVQRICVNASYQALRRRASRANLEEAARREALWRDPAVPPQAPGATAGSSS
jgi:RNA polymerase sigma-70 factor (ECF subfamily)